jgi:hypothetical protein
MCIYKIDGTLLFQGPQASDQRQKYGERMKESRYLRNHDISRMKNRNAVYLLPEPDPCMQKFAISSFHQARRDPREWCYHGYNAELLQLVYYLRGKDSPLWLLTVRIEIRYDYDVHGVVEVLGDLS